MKIRGFIVAALLVTMNSPIYGQQGLPGKSLEEYIEYLVAIGYDEFEATNFSEEISSLKDNPVDINNSTESELGRLFFLTPFQIKNIITYIKFQGPIRSKFELGYIPGFDKELAKLTASYILIRDLNHGSYKRPSTRLTTSLIYSDRDNNLYPGSGIKLTERLFHQSGLVSIGLILDKDKGEKLLYESYKPEFLSGHAQLTLRKSPTKIIIGDYRVRFGQGLSVWHGYSPGISPVNPNMVRGSSRIVPHSSSDENNFFRGFALSTKLKRASLNIYMSSNKIDGNIMVSPDSSITVRSLYDSGLHNSAISESKRDALTENSAGININRNFNNINLGCSLTGTMFSISITPEEVSESLYDFSGTNNLVFSVDHAASLNKIYIYGEAGVNGRGKIAFVEGVRIFPADRVKLNMLYGYTSLSYNSFHGHIFGKETVNNFRRSFLANIEIDVAPHLTLFSGRISYSDLWYGYRSANFPKSTQYMTEIIWNPSDMIRLRLSHRFKESVNDSGVDRGIEMSEQKTTSSSRMHLDLYPSPGLRLSSRFELSSSSFSTTRGLLAYQGIRLEMPGTPLTLISRFYTYNIDSFDNRIYAWEDDLLYHPSVPAMYGKGGRSYFIIDYHPNTNFTLRFKYGHSQFECKEEDILFNEYRMQIRIRLRY